MIFMREVNMKNNRPGILQFDWSIASRHGRINVMWSHTFHCTVGSWVGCLLYKRSISIVLCLIQNPIIF